MRAQEEQLGNNDEQPVEELPVIPKVVKIGPVESEIGERIKLQRLERLAKIQEESKVQQPRDQIELMDSDN